MKWTDKAWERQKGESEKAFEAFVAYRDMGEKRTYTAVAAQLQKSCTLIRRWSHTWDWPERVRSWDNELEKEARAKAIKERKDMTTRHIGIAMQMQKKALEALQELSVKDMSPKDIKEYIKIATDLERLNRDISEYEHGGAAYQNKIEDRTTVDIYMPEKEEETDA